MERNRVHYRAVKLKWIPLIFFASFAWLSPPKSVRSEVVHITILTARQTTINTGTASYQCYRSEPDRDATLAFGRTANIPSDTAPPTDQPHFSQSFIRVVTFSGSSWNTNGFGPFYCQGTKEGRDVTRVSTFFTRSDAKFAPADGVFTRTVNVGDTDISITMTQEAEPESTNNAINWRKDAGAQENIGQLSYQVSNPVQASDEGIYEIHYNTERTSARGSLYRLIVRECPSNMWGPPDCVGVCDKCYNGGVCDDQSGLCICPNNFKGPNCLDIHREDKGNRFGLNCEFFCSSRDNADSCRGALFCLPDPYGCTCDTGSKGLDCTQACSGGTFGAGCTQTCHCVPGAVCNIYSGVCPGECETGWSGDNCQIPDVCDVGYYGSECITKCHCVHNVACDKTTGECPQQLCAVGSKLYDEQVFCEECREGFYGLNCTGQCRCADQACNKVTGICNGQCFNSQWLEPDCQYGITRLTPNEKVNPLSMSSFTCHVTGDPLPNEGAVYFYRINGSEIINDGIVRDHSIAEDGGLAVMFVVNNVYPGDYLCYYSSGGYSASLSTTALTYVLPVLDEPPSVSSMTSSSATLQWSGWTADDVGDGPIIEYTPYFSRLGAENWTEAVTVGAIMTSASITGLDFDTAYEFSVAAAREGPNGMGLRSPATNATTLCGMPSASPSGVTVEAVNPKQLQVSWQVLPESAYLCRSGNYFYRISYSSSGGSATSVIITDISNTSLLLTGLQTYLDYTVYVTAGNKDAESERNNPVVVRTAEEIAPAPSNLAIPRSTPSSFTVSWSAAMPTNLNGIIQKYEIQYQPVIVSGGVGAQLALKEVPGPSPETEYTVEDLEPETNFTVMVRTVNGQGASDWSVPVIARTVITGATGSIAPIVGGAVAGIFIIIIIVVLVAVFLFRRRQRDPKKPALVHDSVTSHSKDNLSTVIYANAGVSIEDENTYEGVDIQKVPPVTERSTSHDPSKSPSKGSNSPSKGSNSKPVAIVKPDKSSRNGPPPVPKPYEDYMKEKTRSSGKLSELDDTDGRGLSASHDNLDTIGIATEAGDIYENVSSFPGPVLATELDEYVQNKKSGDSNGLVQDFSLLKNGQLHSWDVATREKNKVKNRFKNIVAYDRSRVVLEKVNGDPNSDYFNASYMQNYKGETVFIASQAPNAASLTSFWRMLWQENVSTVVMVTNLIEAGKDRCRQYWPEEMKSLKVIGDFSLYLLETETFSDHVVRQMIVRKDGKDFEEEGEKRTITQFHYLSWPDMGVPEHYTTLIDFTENVKEHHNTILRAGHTGPMLVHCSAGVGRTGTFITLYNMLDMMRETGRVDVFTFINKMRENRIKMVQTQEQYVFLFNALLEVYLSRGAECPTTKYGEKLRSLSDAVPGTNKTNLQAEFETLHKLTPLPTAKSFRGGQDPRNRNKNRFQRILPKEKNRPYLAVGGGEDSTNYINASFMNTYLKKDVFVATQSPLPSTVADIWRLVYDWKCPIIVMLNPINPQDETLVEYWPREGSSQLGSLNVTHKATSETAHYITRQFDVSSGGDKVCVDQYEMLGWGASQVTPDSLLALLNLVEVVENRLKTAQSKGPIIVHCINGIGRSGVFCALWSVMERIRHDQKVNIFQAVKRLRACRPNMVQSLDLYRLCYDIIGQHLQRFEEYANVESL